MEAKILRAGDQGLVVDFGETIDTETCRKVHQLAKKIKELRDDRIKEIVPTYRSLQIYFNLLKISRQELTDIVCDALDKIKDVELQLPKKRTIYIPTCYGEEFGPDLDFVAKITNLKPEQVIELHAETVYQVYVLGFVAGFPYLGSVNEKIIIPRLEKPRNRIPAGSVGIGGRQTGLYTVESPGGWRLIGRTPLKTFFPEKENPAFFRPGDNIKFEPITKQEYNNIAEQVAKGQYTPEIKITKMAGDLA
ncbi:5-oxoprolinase subunit PxpB [Selenomonadales bacterium OttesenSCG-928-I06]|nr:5-oxoprolinase subunit PxpB [Selenomonadales bacterium OttesenSCG-928-I06]